MNTNPARGMRDFLPDDVRRRQYVMSVIADVYQRYGFEPLETPAVENIETLMGKYGEEGDRLIFRILKRGEEGKTGEADLALRYDLTVPLARVVAEYRERLPKFFKRYQVQPVWRADRPQKGRFREFYQCDVDAIGSTSLVVEAELLGAAAEVLERLGFSAFTIRLNHRKALGGLLEAAGVAVAKHGEALITLDKLDKVGPDGVTAELASRALLAEADAANLVQLFATGGAATNDDVLRRLRTDMKGHEAGLRGVSELEDIVRLSDASRARGRIRLDPSLARGLSYYTGSIFEIAVPDLTGSLGGGGRYDELVGMFLGSQVAACGISLGLERILVVMNARGMFPPVVGATAAQVMVTIWNADTVADAIRLAGELRTAGLRVDVYPDTDKIGKQVKYADSRGIRFVTIVGTDETTRGEVAVKNLSTGEQQLMPRADVATFIRKHG
ncbi:MAG: histidine--tRNA ligase [Acidobacteria bacterium]|nr:histidine--tRNA ligase [Acidobacteriota bacterium]